MKRLLIGLAALLITLEGAQSIPTNFGGGGRGGFGANVQLKPIDVDMTKDLLAPAVWKKGQLPGEWAEIPSLEGDEVALLTVVPYIFGQRPMAVFANRREGALRSISALFIDAGQFFGYRPTDSTRSKSDLRELQRAFKKRHSDLEDDLGKALKKFTDNPPSDTRVGRTPFLCAHYKDYRHGDGLILRFSSIEGHSVSLTILRAEDARGHYLDEKVAGMDTRDRRKELLSRVSKRPNGDVVIEGIPMFRQGMRPYCAVSTLGMATHYLGLRMGTNALAAGARFRNTGSAQGAKLLDLYRAAAEESGARLQRGSRFDFRKAQNYIEKGFPIVVWRRYSPERNLLHIAAAKGATLPEPDRADRAAWPGKKSPAHASVVTGFNTKTGEVIFSESWGEQARDKRIRGEELEATSYAVFHFKI